MVSTLESPVKRRSNIRSIVSSPKHDRLAPAQVRAVGPRLEKRSWFPYHASVLLRPEAPHEVDGARFPVKHRTWAITRRRYYESGDGDVGMDINTSSGRRSTSTLHRLERPSTRNPVKCKVSFAGQPFRPTYQQRTLRNTHAKESPRCPKS